MTSGLLAMAKRLRQEQTHTEKLLWQELRAKRFSTHKFRRQVPLLGFIADFYCPACKLIIELDGTPHTMDPERDLRRDTILQNAGFRILRFWNGELLANKQGVMETIWHALHVPLSLTPSPARGEGGSATDAGKPLSPCGREVWREGL